MSLMVASFKAVLFAQLHSRPLHHNILLLWDKSMKSLDRLIPLAWSTRLFLTWWLRNLALQFEEGLSSFPLKDPGCRWSPVGDFVVGGVLSSDQHPGTWGKFVFSAGLDHPAVSVILPTAGPGPVVELYQGLISALYIVFPETVFLSLLTFVALSSKDLFLFFSSIGTN